MNRKSQLLLHPLFITSIILLLLNDFLWKYQFHNWFTGKLSDFAGLFAFTVFFFALFNRHRKIVAVIITLFFLWWKSPLSGNAILFFNSAFHLPVNRIIDYSDLVALTVIPFAFYLKEKNISLSYVRRILVGCACIVCFFSFTATTMLRRIVDDNKVKVDGYLKTKKKEDAIVNSFARHGITLKKDSAIYEKIWNNNYYLKATSANGNRVMIPVDSLYNGVYTKISYGSIYTIPEMQVNGDTIQNIQFIIDELNKRKQEIRVHSFEYKKIPDSILYFSSYELQRRFKKPLMKKIKEIIRE
ncbi:MAG: hypothetical protein WDN26_07355 [Chitinophagaceae bacterium]